MANVPPKTKLKKELRLIDIYAIATGTTLSAGFFLLPGIAASQAGPAVILSYLIAAIPLIPSMFSIIELATAMPRAGGVYYFLDRTLGPFFGTIGGLGTWLALILKVAFALVGMGAYISLFVEGLAITPIAITLAILLGVLNYFGSKSSGKIQVLLVFGLLAILLLFVGSGLPELELSNFANFPGEDFSSIFSTAGLVYISYVGITKIASLSEEVKEPEKNLPRGVILSFITAIIIYALGTTVMVGVIPLDDLMADLTPAATAADYIAGEIGVILISVAAILAFISVANAGTLSASRYPLAMSRDHLFPQIFRKLGSKGSPVYALILTVVIIISLIILLDPAGIAKLASSFQLLMFALICLAVIVMRESKIDSYDPGYKSPLYPWMQIFGILSSFWLIFEMGWLPIAFTGGLIVTGSIWYKFYGSEKVSRSGAVYHVFERLGRGRYEGLDIELRGIMKEKGLRETDPFDAVVMHSHVIDIKGVGEFNDIVRDASEWLADFVDHSGADISNQIMEGTRIGATPVTHGVALPHLRIKGLDTPKMVLVRASEGIHIVFNNPLTDNEEEEQIVEAVFFLVSPDNDPSRHLRMLARIAGRVDEDSFHSDWTKAENQQQLRHSLLHNDNWICLTLQENGKTDQLIGKYLRDVRFPGSCLVALVNRHEETLIPRGDTRLEQNDRLTIIGDPKGIQKIHKQFE